ncbi:Phage related hypothetical protein [Polaromonas sp. OV174]|uniref:DUF1799 domain-containing protein n=1 Tax=Polaromonas sp. OV174 TaxID=1855300 RepID=UPI0008F3FD92|nr:DUF1799 domain-containing protein [Polaromonas sp. OV174]SFB96741.1 Phage related hypothetical protein [Polaromonas sp. OV174]
MRDDAPGAFDVDESVIEGMQAWGAPPEELAKAREQMAKAEPVADAETFGVYAENIPVVNAFFSLRTQWQYAGMAGQRMGFNYAGVISWLALNFRPRRRRALMADLQLMESAVLAADHEQRKKEE